MYTAPYWYEEETPKLSKLLDVLKKPDVALDPLARELEDLQTRMDKGEMDELDVVTSESDDWVMIEKKIGGKKDWTKKEDAGKGITVSFLLT